MHILIGIGVEDRVRIYDTEEHKAYFANRADVSVKELSNLEYPRYDINEEVIGVRKLFIVSYITNLQHFVVCDSFKELPYCVDKAILREWLKKFYCVNASIIDGKIAVKGHLYKEEAYSLEAPKLDESLVEATKKILGRAKLMQGAFDNAVFDAIYQTVRDKSKDMAEIIRNLVLLGRQQEGVCFMICYRSPVVAQRISTYINEEIDFLNLTPEQAIDLTVIGEADVNLYLKGLYSAASWAKNTYEREIRAVTGEKIKANNKSVVFLCQGDNNLLSSDDTTIRYYTGAEFMNLQEVIFRNTDASFVSSICFNKSRNLRRVLLPRQNIRLAKGAFEECFNYEIDKLPNQVIWYDECSMMGVSYNSDVLYVHDAVEGIKGMSALTMQFKNPLEIVYFGKQVKHLKDYRADNYNDKSTKVFRGTGAYEEYETKLPLGKYVIVRNTYAVSTNLIDFCILRHLGLIVSENSKMLKRIKGFEQEGTKIEYIPDSEIAAVNDKLQKYCTANDYEFVPLQKASKGIEAVTADMSYSRLPDLDMSLRLYIIAALPGQDVIYEAAEAQEHEMWLQKMSKRFEGHFARFDNYAWFKAAPDYWNEAATPHYTKINLPSALRKTGITERLIREFIEPDFPVIAQYCYSLLNDMTSANRDVACAYVNIFIYLSRRIDLIANDRTVTSLAFMRRLAVWVCELYQCYLDFVSVEDNKFTEEAEYLRWILWHGGQFLRTAIFNEYRIRAVAKEIIRDVCYNTKPGDDFIAQKALEERVLRVPPQMKRFYDSTRNYSASSPKLPAKYDYNYKFNMTMVVQDSLSHIKFTKLYNETEMECIPSVEDIDTSVFLTPWTYDKAEERLNYIGLTMQEVRRKRQSRGVLRVVWNEPIWWIDKPEEVLKLVKYDGDLLVQHLLTYINAQEIAGKLESIGLNMAQTLALKGFLLALLRHFNAPLANFIEQKSIAYKPVDLGYTLARYRSMYPDDFDDCLTVYYNSGSHFFTSMILKRYVRCGETYRTQETKDNNKGHIMTSFLAEVASLDEDIKFDSIYSFTKLLRVKR